MSDKLTPYSKLGKINRKKLSDIIPINKPFTIFIEPTNICNFKCVQCPHGLDDYAQIAGPLQNMDFKCFEKIVKDLNKWRKIDNTNKCFLKVIRLYLEGEPFCNSNICEMLKILKENNFAERIEIITNGSLFNQDILEKLVKYELDYLTISIYSINEEKNKKITNSNINPNKIKENIVNLIKIRNEAKSNKPFVYVKIIDTYDEKENNEFREYYKNIADEVCIEKPMDWNGSEEGKFIEKLYESDSEKIKEDLYNKKNRKACPFPFHTLSIKSNGDVLVCCVDWLRNTKVGNVMNNTLQEIWNGREMYNLRKMHIEGHRKNNISCNNCQLPNTLSEEDNIDDFTIDKL